MLAPKWRERPLPVPEGSQSQPVPSKLPFWPLTSSTSVAGFWTWCICTHHVHAHLMYIHNLVYMHTIRHLVGSGFFSVSSTLISWFCCAGFWTRFWKGKEGGWRARRKNGEVRGRMCVWVPFACCYSESDAVHEKFGGVYKPALPSCFSFFFGMVLVTASCTMLWTSLHSSSGIRSNPLNLFITFTV